MALYFKDIEITNIDNLVPQTGLDITDIWFGEMSVYTVWQVYEGTLPATINTNGSDLRQYQIYGNTGGVGDRTENVPFGYEVVMSVSDGTNTTTTPIYIGDDPLDKDEYIDYQAGKIYRLGGNIFDPLDATIYNWYFNASNPQITVGNNPRSIYIPCESNTKYILYKTLGNVFRAGYTDELPAPNTSVYGGVYNDGGEKIEILTGSNAEYLVVEFVSSPNTTTINNALNSLSIYKQTPTNPPVPLPALPTCEGATIVDYTGQSVAPEKAILKYRKKNF